MQTALVGVLVAVLLALTPDARAELYRWRDPQTGTIKYSSYPPPWYGDETREANAPKVEVLGNHQPSDKERGTPADEMAEKVAEVVRFMEQRRGQLLARMTVARASAGFDPSDPAFQADLQAYRGVTRELDKFDAKGAAARRSADARVFENLGITMGATGVTGATGAETQPVPPESARGVAEPPPPASGPRGAPESARAAERPARRQ